MEAFLTKLRLPRGMTERMIQTVESCSGSNAVRSLYQAGGKRLLDVGIVVLVAPAVLPVVAVLWAVVRWQDGGAGLHCCWRIGRGGRRFACWKLRSMVPAAEVRLARCLEGSVELREEWQRRQKLARDPRVTPVGRWLRRTGFDELPQLWNVLRGEMSLVGPRPVSAGELPRYGPAAAAYLDAHPGVTGLWQVAERGKRGEWDARIRADQDYLRDISLRRDFGILLRTCGVIWRAEGE